MTKALGTPAFMPPEVMVEEPKYNKSVDIFSYGVLMIHVFSGKWPVPQIGQIRTEGSCLIPVSEAKRRQSFLQAIGSDHPLMHLIHKCINNNPKMRANTSEIVDQLADMIKQHPIPFTNQLDMIEYISRLEERNDALERENSKDKGCRRSRSEVDPKMDTHQNKKKAFKIKNLFSSKQKVLS